MHLNADKVAWLPKSLVSVPPPPRHLSDQLERPHFGVSLGFVSDNWDADNKFIDKYWYVKYNICKWATFTSQFDRHVGGQSKSQRDWLLASPFVFALRNVLMSDKWKLSVRNTTYFAFDPHRNGCRFWSNRNQGWTLGICIIDKIQWVFRVFAFAFEGAPARWESFVS